MPGRGGETEGFNLSARIFIVGQCVATAIVFFSMLLRLSAQEATATLAWDPSPSTDVVGYQIYWGVASQTYTSMLDVGMNTSATITGLIPGLTYYVAALAYSTNQIESPFSNEASFTVPLPLTILNGPMSQTVDAGGVVAFTVSEASAAPVCFQWYFNGTPLYGDTNSTLVLTSVADTNAGSYNVLVSSATGSATSGIGVLQVNDPIVIAGTGESPGAAFGETQFSSLAGVYNGLFYETNGAGIPAITEQTAGMLDNCIVGPNGSYTARLYLDGSSYFLAGTLNSQGSDTVYLSRSAHDLGRLTVALQLDMTGNTGQIAGQIWGETGTNVWVSTLLADLATNGLSVLPETFVGLMTPETNSFTSTEDDGLFTINIRGDSVNFAGYLADWTSFSQSAPISKDGNIPVYVSLYGGLGLFEGWVNVAGDVVNGTATWIRPAGIASLVPYPQGFTNIVAIQNY
jgi:hypothetical protein